MVFDILVLITLIVSALIAFLRGAIREILTILGVIGGLAAAYYGGPHLIPHMEGWLGVEPPQEGVTPEKLLGILPYDILAQILSYGLIFIVVVIVLSIISHMLAETARALGLGPVDRTLGVIFGLARGILLLGVIYFPFHLMLGPEEKEEWFEGSKTFFFVEQTSEAIAQFVPEKTVAKFQKDAESVQEGLEANDRLNELKGNNAEKKEPAPQDGKGGYTDEFRDQMDNLFEAKPDDSKALEIKPLEKKPAEPTPQPNE
jgi:membrane protein required for colicin V production